MGDNADPPTARYDWNARLADREITGCFTGDPMTSVELNQAILEELAEEAALHSDGRPIETPGRKVTLIDQETVRALPAALGGLVILGAADAERGQPCGIHKSLLNGITWPGELYARNGLNVITYHFAPWSTQKKI